MRSSFAFFAALLGLALFAAAPAGAQLAGTDTAPGSSCAGFAAGATRITADADQDGKEVTLICDGSTWEAVRNDLIALPNPNPCDGTIEGALRYSSAAATIELCDGTEWRLIAAQTAGGDTTPDAFTFTDVTDQPLGQLIYSNIVNITGIDTSTVASVTGGGSPQISINGGSWVSSGEIKPGETLQVRLSSSPSASTELVAVVTVGGGSDNWSVTTTADNTKVFVTASSYNGNLGGIGGAHATCQSEAAGLGYGGVWRALLSNGGINAKDLLTIEYPVIRASDGTTIDASNLWDGSITNPINTLGNYQWSGTVGDGTRSPSTCNDWRTNSSAILGRSGRANDTSRWISNVNDACNATRTLYCVSQPAPLGAILTVSPADVSGLYVYGGGSPVYGDAVTLTVENVGDATSETISTALSNTTNFEFVTDNCNGQTLAQGATCSVSIRPKATAGGSFAGFFNVTADNDPSVALSGVYGTLFFLTTNTYFGDLGGLAGADAICQGDADNAGLSGTWKAVLSTDTVDAKDRITLVYPTRTMNLDIASSANMWVNYLENRMDYRADGSGPINTAAWTGTDIGGTAYAGENCVNWTSIDSGDSTWRGQPNHTTSQHWLSQSTITCDNTTRIICALE